MFKKQKILFLILSVILILPNLVFAEVTIKSMIESVVSKVVWPIAAGVAVTLWIITGILFLSAQGAPEKLKQAKTALFTAIAGTVLVILAYSAIELIKNALGTQ